MIQLFYCYDKVAFSQHCYLSPRFFLTMNSSRCALFLYLFIFLKWIKKVKWFAHIYCMSGKMVSCFETLSWLKLKFMIFPSRKQKKLKNLWKDNLNHWFHFHQVTSMPLVVCHIFTLNHHLWVTISEWPADWHGDMKWFCILCSFLCVLTNNFMLILPSRLSI